MEDYSNRKIETLRTRFVSFAEFECKEVSPMYYFLATNISEDDDLLDISKKCIIGQPMPNLFFASVQYLLFKNPETELAQFYPSISNNEYKEFDFNIFKNFCLKYKDEIIKLEQTKLVQTNSLNRCAYLMPILSHLYGGKEINVVDLGTSAGLILNLDQYEYHYNDRKLFGDSKVQVKSEIREGEIPSFKEYPIFKNKTGIDQNPLDLKNEDNALWLKALIWSDLTARFTKMKHAIELASKSKLNLIKAQSLDEFRTIFESQSKDIPLVIYHTIVLYQFSKENRIAFWKLIDDIGSQRDLTYIAAENASALSNDYGKKGFLIEEIQYKAGKKTNKLVAETNGHANWIKWYN